MNQTLLCRWLAVDCQAWPPDPYKLLGLADGEADLARIEQHVHDQMAKLRGYQLSHPEEATEGMNRVAQAFVSLSEAAARKQVCLPGNGAARVKVLDETKVGHQTVTDWQQAPPPVRRPGDSGSLPVVQPEAPPAPATAGRGSPDPALAAGRGSPDSVGRESPAPASCPADPWADDVRQLSESRICRAGIGTLEALIERIYHTRRLLVAWNAAGPHLDDPAKNGQTDPRQLARRLKDIERQMDGFPPILGQPGKPGYRIVAMARLGMTASMLHQADETQRQLLSLDWQAGRRVLLAYRKFLRVQFKPMRRHGPMRLVWLALRFFFNDHPRLTVTGALVIAAISAYLLLR